MCDQITSLANSLISKKKNDTNVIINTNVVRCKRGHPAP